MNEREINGKLSGLTKVGALVVLLLLAVLVCFMLYSPSRVFATTTIELVDVSYDGCFSPNGGGVKDVMNLAASFQGPAGRPVFALLLIRRDGNWVNFRIGAAIFSSAGKAEIKLNWDGKNIQQQPVADGTYELVMYYFNMPILFSQLQGKSLDRVRELVEQRMVGLQVGDFLKRWDGETQVDRVKPVLIVSLPEEGLKTYAVSVQTEGTVEGAETLTINDVPIQIDDNRFAKSLSLEPGMNPFHYVAEDCGGNRDTATRTVERLTDETPPSVTIQNPQEGGLYTALPVAVAVVYQDGGSGIDLSTLKVLLNGNDITSSLSASASGVEGEISDESLLNDGANTLRVEVKDKVGNAGSGEVHFIFQKIAEKDKTFIYGRVLEMGTGQPLADVVISASGKTEKSDAEGRWKLLFGDGGTYKIKITKENYSEVYRKCQVNKGKEAVVEDAYLTVLDAKTTPIGPEGGTHSNGDGTMEIVIPAGALSEVKNVQTTRLAGSLALPGALNETDGLEYPINFLFCADLRPNGTTFSQPVKLRVRNSWGFTAGMEIPFAFWDTQSLKWTPAGMAKISVDQEWLEADISHFSTLDINVCSTVPDDSGYPDTDDGPPPDCPTCHGSSVDSHGGSLQTDFSIPGVKVRGGDTGLSMVYSSQTAHPTRFIRVFDYQWDALVRRPIRTELKIDSSLLGGDSGFASPGKFHFNPPSLYGSGALLLNGFYPSGRVVETGYQNISFSFTNFYPGTYAVASKWGGKPTGTTTVVSLEPSYLEDRRDERFFMVSRVHSEFGRGWHLANLEKLYFDGDRAVIVNGDGSLREFERGVNYADSGLGATVKTYSHTMYDYGKMLKNGSLKPLRQDECARFYFSGTPPENTNQSFVIDLGQERDIYRIGIDFSQYWNRLNVWDMIKISTSLDNVDFQEWSQTGEATLKDPRSNEPDAYDFAIQSPWFTFRDNRTMRYIKFELGYPSVNTTYPGSAIYRVYAYGSENQYHLLGEEKWPRLYLDEPTGNFILEEYSGSKTVFNGDGLMIQEKERSGRTISYEYSGNRLTRISHPEGVWMEFIYGVNGKLEKVKDSTGRETLITMDAAGNLLEVVFPDGEKREFSYNERGLLTNDKKGNAEKKYTWDEKYPVLKEVELANNGKHVFDPWVLKYLLNELESSPDNPIDFPFNVSGHDGVESIVTMEDGRIEKQVTGRGWSWKYENDKLREKITYADLRQNRLPVKVERGESGWETSDIGYNDDMQVSLMQGHLKDKSWTKEAMDNHAPYAPLTSDYNMLTRNTAVYYNDQRLVAKVNDYGTEKQFSYDAKGNLTQVIESSTLYKTTKYTYNENGDLTKVEYPDGKVNEMAYDEKGLVIEVKNNDSTKTTIERNERGEVIGITDEENRKVELTRDVMGRVIKEKSPSTREVSYQWGGAGCLSCGDGSKLVKITDAGGNNWEFKYDTMGNPIEMFYPDNTKISQEYDIAGRLIKFTNKREQEINYTYDTDGKLVKKTTSEGDIDFTYDERDRITQIQASDFDYKYSYGVVDGGWLGVVGNSVIVKEENLLNSQWSETLTNYHGLPRDTFDSFGWHKSFIYDFATTPVAYAPVQILYGKRYVEYDKLTINNSYDNGLRIYKKTNSRFNNETFQYFDTNGLMSGVLYRAVSGYTGCWPTGKLNFGRDNSGLIEQITDDLALTANYDPDLEITSVNHTVLQSFDEAYTYDSRGNRLTDLTKTYLYDNLNKLIDSTTHLYGYDLDGNLILEKNKLTSETKKYYWDSENRLVKYEHQATDISPVDVTAEYKYDIYGRRLQKNVNGTITNFMWEGDNLSLELDGTNQPIRKYFTEANMDDYFGHLEYSEVINWSKIFDYNYPQGWYGYLKDQVGTIYRVWDRNLKQYAETRAYETFGNLINFIGTTKTNLGFQGKYFDIESGLNYFYHRYYSPNTGRFISEDPIGLRGGLNIFGFTLGNPMNFIDPKGTITDVNSFPQYFPLQGTGRINSEYNVTIWDYIGWIVEGGINSITNAVNNKFSDDCPQNCEKVFWDCMRDWISPGPTDLVETSAAIIGNYNFSYAWFYAAVKNLTFPLRSSIFRTWYYFGLAFSPTVAASLFTSVIWFCLIKETICLIKQ